LSSQSSLPTLSTLPHFDKLEHLGVYALLGALVFRAFRAYGMPARRAAVFAFVVGAFYGVSDEFHQSFVPQRTADVFDALADGTGASLGALGWWAVTQSLWKD
jgi:VanZ family protein